MTGLVALSSWAAETACDTTCTSLGEASSSMMGQLSYTEADGQAVTGPVGQGSDDFYVNDDANGLGVDGSFVDASGETRDYILTVDGLSGGATTDLAGNGTICFPRQANGQPVCTPLTGSVVVHAISSTCEGAGGVGTCAQTLQATLQGASSWEGTKLVLQISFAETGTISSSACDPDEGS